MNETLSACVCVCVFLSFIFLTNNQPHIQMKNQLFLIQMYISASMQTNKINQITLTQRNKSSVCVHACLILDDFAVFGRTDRDNDDDDEDDDDDDDESDGGGFDDGDEPGEQANPWLNKGRCC